MRGRTFSGDVSAGERCRAFDGISYVGFVVGAVEVDAVPAAVYESVVVKHASTYYLRWIQDVGSNTSWTCISRKPFSIKFGIRARSCVVSAEVWRIVAAEA
jgi:hypothetical protein